ncbi:hypothetical protein TIFTF001_043703 [Ficus carica]|uniref:Uncharacterized protein n=1 Tax=Ficus carica TaxID=3494 RepID=A0AA87Z8V9_FICCA|nr:hypothetical protein TIFTF001_043703 [Ficus carica]
MGAELNSAEQTATVAAAAAADGEANTPENIEALIEFLLSLSFLIHRLLIS